MITGETRRNALTDRLPQCVRIGTVDQDHPDINEGAKEGDGMREAVAATGDPSLLGIAKGRPFLRRCPQRFGINTRRQKRAFQIA